MFKFVFSIISCSLIFISYSFADVHVIANLEGGDNPDFSKATQISFQWDGPYVCGSGIGPVGSIPCPGPYTQPDGIFPGTNNIVSGWTKYGIWGESGCYFTRDNSTDPSTELSIGKAFETYGLPAPLSISNFRIEFNSEFVNGIDYIDTYYDTGYTTIGDVSIWVYRVTALKEKQESVPTMSEWGLILFFLTLIWIGTVKLYQKKVTETGRQC